jgi:hypothetical protein
LVWAPARLLAAPVNNATMAAAGKINLVKSKYGSG